MKKTAIILDSFCGRSKKEVEKNDNYFFLPLKIIINGKLFLDGVDSDAETLMKMINESNDIKTSQPAPAEIIDLYEKLSKEYENVIFFPAAAALSGTAQTAKMLAKDFSNVHVVSGFGVGRQLVEIGNWCLKETEKGKKIEEIIAFAKSYITDKPTFIVPKNIEAFLKSGRMGKSLSKIFETMHIVPIASLQDEEKLKKRAVKRSGKKACEFVVEKMIEKILPQKEDYIFQICTTLDEEFSKKTKLLLEQKGFKVHVERTSAIVSSHTGNGAFSLGAFKKINK